MFTKSTTTLRGCSHPKVLLHGLCRRRSEALFHDSRTPALSRWHWSQPDPRATEKAPSEEREEHPSPSSSATPPVSSDNAQSPGFCLPPAGEVPAPLESRVQTVRPRAVTHPLRDPQEKFNSVARLSNRIFGRKGKLIPQALGAPKQPELGAQASALNTRTSLELESTDSDSREEQNHDYQSFRSFWTRNYDKLFERMRYGEGAIARRNLGMQKQRAEAFVGERSLEQLQDAWDEVPSNQKLLVLPDLLLGCLVDSARRTLMMLSINISIPHDWRVRCECLCHLDMMYRKEIKRDPELRALFAKQIEQVSRISAWPLYPMPWFFLVLLLRHNGPEHCERIVDAILQDQSVSPRLVFVMIDHFTKIRDADRALDLLSRIPPEEWEEHKVRILDRAANLISIDTIEKTGSVVSFRALSALIRLGLPLDSRAHNRLIQRAVTLGMPDVAWEVLNFMEAKGIPADAESHVFLLKDSFERNDSEKLEATMSAIHGRKDLYQWPYVITYMMNIVRIICTVDRKVSPEISVSHLLAIYDRVYDRAPLVRLGLVNASLSEESSQEHLQQPPPVVLGFTIWAYVLCQRDERLVSALWFWIVHMIKQGDETILECARHDVMYNGFIHFYAKSRFFLGKAVDVVEAMIEHNLCMPTERTWSEVLCGFLNHGEEETARKIWRTMLASGFQPTRKGWGFLMGKFTQTNLADLVKHVLDERRMPGGIDTALGWGNYDETLETEHWNAQEDKQGLSEATVEVKLRAEHTLEGTDEVDILKNDSRKEDIAGPTSQLASASERQ